MYLFYLKNNGIIYAIYVALFLQSTFLYETLENTLEKNLRLIKIYNRT
jgi:hypothetical protein